MTSGAARPVPDLIRGRDDVAAHIDAAVRYGRPGTVGAELELLAVDVAAPVARPSLAHVAALLPTALPHRSTVTTEPGGQVELSSLPGHGPGLTVARLAEDLLAVRSALDAGGVRLAALGADPLRPPVRLLRTSRYDCMEAYFAGCGEPSASAGPAMMCSTAAVQVSVDAGERGAGVQSAGERWRRAHAIGPALVAAFACSPVLSGQVTGWRSTRQRIWGELDPSRTRPPAPDLDPVDALADLALSARLLTIRDADGTCRPAPERTTFGQWLAEGPRPPGDLAYHLTTLFPPVRLRGWLEVRYVDMLPDPLWEVPVAVTAALLDDDLAADRARDACATVEGRWRDAALHATADGALRRAAEECLVAAAAALTRSGETGLAAAVEGYLERFTARGRCPADDLLDALAAGTPLDALLLGPVEATA